MHAWKVVGWGISPYGLGCAAMHGFDMYVYDIV
jgi:hypothetical protein